MIKLKNVNKKFGKLEVLKKINIEFTEGVTAILGPSGSGKSTMLRCINCLEKVTGGDIIVYGHSVLEKGKIQQIRQMCGMVFQQFNLFPHLSVIDNITLSPRHLLKVSRDQAEMEAFDLLRKVGLEEKATFFPIQLSGGQQQRVAIARALAMKPKALLLDEITSALDPEMSSEVLTILEKLADEGITMVMVTHEISIAKKACDRTIFIEDGSIAYDAPPDIFFSDDNVSLRIKDFFQHRD